MDLIKQSAGILAVISLLTAVGGFAISVSTKELVVILETMEIIYERKAFAASFLISIVFGFILYNLNFDKITLSVQVGLFILISYLYIRKISKKTKEQLQFFLSNGQLNKSYSITIWTIIVSLIVIVNCYYIFEKFILNPKESLFYLTGYIVIMLAFYIVMLLSCSSYLCNDSMMKLKPKKISFIQNNNVIEYIGYLLGEYKQLFCLLAMDQGEYKRIFIKKDLVTQIKEQ